MRIAVYHLRNVIIEGQVRESKNYENPWITNFISTNETYKHRGTH
jgi:ABC-type transporter Mla maintaining outer membrane lipid asymmetry ATPase subunit MlaF